MSTETDSIWEAKVHEQEEQVSKAFVSICVYMPYQPEERQFAPFSGFVFDVEGQWFLVTAEHVFTGHDEHVGLDKLLELHPETIVELQPFWGGRSTATRFNASQPNRLTTSQLAEMWRERVEPHIYEAMKGADLIAIALSEYYEQHLKAVGVEPLGWDQVQLIDKEEAMELLKGETVSTKLFGIPEKGVETKDGVASAWLLRLPVAPAGEEPPFTYWEPTWDAENVPYDVRGTSGGPIMLLGAKTPYFMGIQIAQGRVDGQRRLKAVNAFAFFEFLASWVQYATAQTGADAAIEERA